MAALSAADSPKFAKRRPQLQFHGGLDCNFVEDPPEHLQTECSVCLSILREPVLIDCDCGSSFCRECIEPIKAKGKSCPLCNGAFSTAIPDRRLQRTLNSLVVYCSYKKLGCNWTGKLNEFMTSHLISGETLMSSDASDGECLYVGIDCPHCQMKIQRRHIDDHKTNLCPKRPYRCDCCDDYESTFEDVSMNHVSVCPSREVHCPKECGAKIKLKNLMIHLSKQCPLEVVECSLRYVGCKEKLPRKDMPAHIKDNLAEHMLLQAINMERQLKEQAISIERQLKEQAISTERQLKDQAISHQQQLDKVDHDIKLLKFENGSLKKENQELRMHVNITPVTLKIDNFDEHKKKEDEWLSNPFYTHPCGYNMRLCVYADGCGEGKGTHLSAFTKIIQGKFDRQLEWPFQGQITFKLLDQQGDQHFTYTTRYDADTPDNCKCRVTGRVGSSRWGFSSFIPNDRLRPRYLKDNSLVFEVSFKQNN